MAEYIYALVLMLVVTYGYKKGKDVSCFGDL
jgi:hypothetical protein